MLIAIRNFIIEILAMTLLFFLSFVPIIGFATAPGSNATSAAEYVVSALLVLAGREGIGLAGRRVGIVGCGNVGSRVRDRLTALLPGR